MTIRRSLLRRLLPVPLALGALLAGGVASSQAYTTGVANETAAMFQSPLFTQLHTRITRYIAPYDAAVHGDDLARAKAYIRFAESEHIQVLVAFYHSEHTPTRLPSVHTYLSDVKKFMKDFPEITQYQPWNEANRGNVAGLFKSPTAPQAASYYLALRRACSRCTNVGLDVLDAANINPTLRYIRSFEAAVRHAHKPLPHIWGLHNYSDTNRFSSSRTRAVLALVPGRVWLTETGGVVQFGRSFPNRHGEGLTRAARALTFMFKLASLNSRIARLYIFDWSGADPTTRFDAGLLDAGGAPRPGYVVVCKKLRAKVCSGFPVAKD